MSPENLLESRWLVRIVIILLFASAISVMFLFNKIDGILHGDLYNFGLRFSFYWANPYWASLSLIFISWGLPLALSLLVLGLNSFRKSTNKHVGEQEGKSVDVRSESLKEDRMVVSCPSCRKVFSKTLVIIDFSGERPKLVNVCPYCNHVLGCADEGESNSDLQLVDMEKKLVH